MSCPTRHRSSAGLSHFARRPGPPPDLPRLAGSGPGPAGGRGAAAAGRRRACRSVRDRKNRGTKMRDSKALSSRDDRDAPAAGGPGGTQTCRPTQGRRRPSIRMSHDWRGRCVARAARRALVSQRSRPAGRRVCAESLRSSRRACGLSCRDRGEMSVRVCVQHAPPITLRAVPIGWPTLS
jgi:hypothetical protein